MEGARLSLIIVINQCGRLVVMPDCCIVLAFIWPDSSRSENFVRADGGIPDFDGGGIPDLWKRAVLWTLAVLIVFHAISSISALVALRPIGLLLSKLPLQTAKAPIVAVRQNIGHFDGQVHRLHDSFD